jgi:uncharacterized protein YndB with AHSA1/START domain
MLEKPSVQDLTLHIQQEIEIAAPPEKVFASILATIGPEMDLPDGSPMNMKLEAWPGGRWYRDLGNNTGHLWGHVQVIKPPTLLELHGPMFMSYAAVSHIQYRLKAEGKGTRLYLTHQAIGNILPEHREGVGKGWGKMIEMIKERAMR